MFFFLFFSSKEIEGKAEKCLFNSKHLQCNSKRKWEKNNDSMGGAREQQRMGFEMWKSFIFLRLLFLFPWDSFARASNRFSIQIFFRIFYLNEECFRNENFSERERNLLINLRR